MGKRTLWQTVKNALHGQPTRPNTQRVVRLEQLETRQVLNGAWGTEITIDSIDFGGDTPTLRAAVTHNEVFSKWDAVLPGPEPAVPWMPAVPVSSAELMVSQLKGVADWVTITTPVVKLRIADGRTVNVPQIPTMYVLGKKVADLGSADDVRRFDGELEDLAREAFNRQISVAKKSLEKLDNAIDWARREYLAISQARQQAARLADQFQAAVDEARRVGESAEPQFIQSTDPPEEATAVRELDADTAEAGQQHLQSVARKNDLKAARLQRKIDDLVKEIDKDIARKERYLKKGETILALMKQIEIKTERLQLFKLRIEREQHELAATMAAATRAVLQTYTGLRSEAMRMETAANGFLNPVGLHLNMFSGSVGPVSPGSGTGSGPGNGNGGGQQQPQPQPPSPTPEPTPPEVLPPIGRPVPPPGVGTRLDVDAFTVFQQQTAKVVEALNDAKRYLGSREGQAYVQLTVGLSEMAAGVTAMTAGAGAVGGGIAVSGTGVGVAAAVPAISQGAAWFAVGTATVADGWMRVNRAINTLW